MKVTLRLDQNLRYRGDILLARFKTPSVQVCWSPRMGPDLKWLENIFSNWYKFPTKNYYGIQKYKVRDRFVNQFQFFLSSSMVECTDFFCFLNDKCAFAVCLIMDTWIDILSTWCFKNTDWPIFYHREWHYLEYLELKDFLQKLGEEV